MHLEHSNRETGETIGLSSPGLVRGLMLLPLGS